MSALELFFLGPAEIKVDGQLVKLGLKPLAVLAYLALNGRTNRRELARMLWPEANDPLNSLSAARVSLAKSLGGWLEGDVETICLSEGFYCDVIDFRKNAHFDLWRGPFLHGFRLPDWENGLGEEFEEWVYNTREALADERRDLASDLAIKCLGQGSLDNATPLLEIAQGENDSPREDATRLLILALGALEQPDRAATAYNNLSRNLRAELGVEPTATTRAAWELARASAAACREILQKEFAPAEAQTIIPTLEGETPFVGREDELSELVQEFKRAMLGEARAALIAGEPGAGKTRLAHELLQRADNTLIALGISAQSALPMAALDRVARTMVRLRPQVIGAMNQAWRDALARFLPDLLTPQGAAGTPDVEKRGLFEALRLLLTDNDRPTILVLDDLQWADNATLEFALHLLNNPGPKGFLLLGTLRDTEESVGNLPLLLEPLARRGFGQIIKLGPLSETAIATLAKQLGRDEDIDRLSRFSGGNPFYLIELLQAEPGASTKRLQDLVRARLAALPEIANQLLEALAIIGNGTSTAMVRKVAGRSLEEAAEGLDKLSRAGVLRLEDEGIRFGHDLTRQVVIDDLKKVRRELLELRTAHAFKDNAILAAPHYWQAKEAWDESDVAQALNSFTTSGSTYALRGDLKGGLAWFERAFGISENNASKIRVLTARANVLERHLQFEEAARDLDQAQMLAVGADPVTQASIWNTRGFLLATRLGDAQGAAELAQKSLEVLEKLETFEAQEQRSDALNNLGVSFSIQNDFEQAEKYHRMALQIREMLGIKDKIARSLYNLGLSIALRKKPEAKAILLKAIDILKSINDQVNLTGVYTNLGYVEFNLGNYQEAEKNFLSAMQIQRLFGDEYIFASTLNNLGAALFQQGKYEKAKNTYKMALNSKDLTENLGNMIDVYSNLAEVEIRLGFFAEAGQNLAKVREVVNENDADLEAFLSFQEAELCIFEKNWQKAASCYREMIKWAKESHNKEYEAMALSRLARLEKDPAIARQAIEIEDSAITRASLHFALGNYAEAKKEIGDLTDQYEEKRLIWDLDWLINDNTVA